MEVHPQIALAASYIRAHQAGWHGHAFIAVCGRSGGQEGARKLTLFVSIVKMQAYAFSHLSSEHRLVRSHGHFLRCRTPCARRTVREGITASVTVVSAAPPMRPRGTHMGRANVNRRPEMMRLERQARSAPCARLGARACTSRDHNPHCMFTARRLHAPLATFASPSRCCVLHGHIGTHASSAPMRAIPCLRAYRSLQRAVCIRSGTLYNHIPSAIHVRHTRPSCCCIPHTDRCGPALHHLAQ